MGQNVTKCNQNCNNNKCLLKCKNPKEQNSCKEDYLWNPAACSCESVKYVEKWRFIDYT